MAGPLEEKEHSMQKLLTPKRLCTMSAVLWAKKGQMCQAKKKKVPSLAQTLRVKRTMRMRTCTQLFALALLPRA